MTKYSLRSSSTLSRTVPGSSPHVNLWVSIIPDLRCITITFLSVPLSFMMVPSSYCYSVFPLRISSMSAKNSSVFAGELDPYSLKVKSSYFGGLSDLSSR